MKLCNEQEGVARFLGPTFGLHKGEVFDARLPDDWELRRLSPGDLFLALLRRAKELHLVPIIQQISPDEWDVTIWKDGRSIHGRAADPLEAVVMAIDCLTRFQRNTA